MAILTFLIGIAFGFVLVASAAGKMVDAKDGTIKVIDGHRFLVSDLDRDKPSA